MYVKVLNKVVLKKDKAKLMEKIPGKLGRLHLSLQERRLRSKIILECLDVKLVAYWVNMKKSPIAPNGY